jgi:hypothetical protein
MPKKAAKKTERKNKKTERKKAIKVKTTKGKKVTTSKTKCSRVVNLGALDIGEEKIYAMPLPTNCNGIIVNYSRRQAIRISCKIPAKTYEVSLANCYTNKKFKITAPTLLLSANYWDMPRQGRYPIEGYYLYGLNNRETKQLWVAPYIVSNVYANGKICFGGFEPTSLRAAYNLFWSTPFNSELIEVAERWIDYGSSVSRNIYNGNVAGVMKKYRNNVFAEQDWEDLTEDICGNKFWAAPSGAGALLVTNNKKLLQKIPKTHWRKHGDFPIIIAKLTRFKKSWGFNSGTVKFTLPHENVTFKIYKNKREKTKDPWK